MEISPYKFNLPGADPKPDYVHVVSTLYRVLVLNNNYDECVKNAKVIILLHFQHHFSLQASSPDTYRGKFNQYNSSPDQLKNLYVDEIESICRNIKANGKGVAAFIAESLQSCGGQIIPPDGYFEDVYK